jgi:hypothetical protein
LRKADAWRLARGILLCGDGSVSLLCFEFLGPFVGLLGLSSRFRELLLGELFAVPAI